MNKLILIRSTPGSCNFSRGILMELSYTDCVLIEPDMYFINDEGEYVFNPEKIKDAYNWCQDTTRYLLVSGRSVIVRNTFTKLRELQPYLDITNSVGVDVGMYKVVDNYDNNHNTQQHNIDCTVDNYEPYPNEVVI